MSRVGRRALLCGAVIGAATLVGCLGEESDDGDTARSIATEEPPQEREYDAEHPFSISLINERETAENVAIEVARNGSVIFGETVDVDTDERRSVVEYETTGRYTIRAETDDHQMETATDIERENLMTHRTASGLIRVHEDGVLIQVLFED